MKPYALCAPSLPAGESVANLADVFGTAFGIALARLNLPVLPTFCVLSAGYLYSSRCAPFAACRACCVHCWAALLMGHAVDLPHLDRSPTDR